MPKKITVSLLVLALCGTLIGSLPLLGQEQSQAQGQQKPMVPQGPGMFLFMLFNSLQADDLVVLQNGSLASGTVEEEEFVVGNRTLSRDEILLISWGAAGEATESPIAQVLLRDGGQVQGTLQASSIIERLLSGEEVELPVAELRGIIFKVELPEDASAAQLKGAFFPLFKGLRGNTLLQAILQGLQKFDLLIFPQGELLSADIGNEEFTLNSPIFGVHTFAVADLAQIIFDDPDRLVLRIGDQVSGTVTPDGDGQVRATAVATGAMLSLAKDELQAVLFKLPAGSLGGGGRPHFQPGPGS